MNDRHARGVIAALTLIVALAVMRVRLPEFWGDGATYYAMAWSLAEDGDIRYEARDILRVRKEFPGGPQGLFLKRGAGGLTFEPSFHRVTPEEQRLYFAKAFAYPMVAAPFVRVFGTPGLLLTNALAFGLALLSGYTILRKREATPLEALAATIVLFGATVAPVYLVWPAPEMMNVGVIAAGLAAWACGWPITSALLLGFAVYSKPYNLFLALPLGVEPFLRTAEPWTRRLLESTRRGAVLAATVIALFGLHIALTGEANYQGGERKTFYNVFPEEWDASKEHKATFGNTGIWMSTNDAGPGVEGTKGGFWSQVMAWVGGDTEPEDSTPPPTTLSAAKPKKPQGEPPRSAEELRASFVRNLGYFWVGRFGGALPYFLPAVAALLVWLVRGPRDQQGALAVASLAVSYVFYIYMIPDNWYGGSGTVGNRYFLNLLPLAALFVPRGRVLALSVASAVASLAIVGPMLFSPLHHSLHPGEHARQGPFFRLLPAELTMLNDLSIFVERWRWKRPVGDTEGDAWRNWPADPKAYYLYFPDDGAYGRENLGGDDGPQGFWLRGARDAEIFVRALEPVTKMTIRVTGGPAGDEVTVQNGSRTTITAAPGQRSEGTIEPARPFVYKDTFLYVLHFTSTKTGPEPATGRDLGSFVEIKLDVAKRPTSR